jgi:hypothetical protein
VQATSAEPKASVIAGLPSDIVSAVQACPFDELTGLWSDILGMGDWAIPALARADRFYLLTMLLHRYDALHPWLYARCREVEADPDGYLDLWAREHYKSTIITFAGVIQEHLRDSELTVGIFSHTKPIAKKFLQQIKVEYETNADLKAAFPDVLWAEPAKDAPKWSLDGGLVLKRQGNPKEASLEAHGLVDGQPTGAHFGLLVYDDVVTLESVGTPEQIEKTTLAWSLSDNLGARGEDGRIRKWHIGTRYHFADTYHTMMERKSVIPRIYPATEDGTETGRPVFLTEPAWALKRRDQIPAVLAAQMLQNPAAAGMAMFDPSWGAYMDVRPVTLNVYVLCDPASSKKKGSDNTAIAVLGLDSAWNVWLLDGLYDKLNLAERWAAIKGFRRHWQQMPGVQALRVGYERYGMQSDIEYFQIEMERDADAFEIVELNWPREGLNSKPDRIQRLVPYVRSNRFYLPEVPRDPRALSKRQEAVVAAGQAFRVYKPTRRTDHQGRIYSLNDVFAAERASYPYSVHDDFLDACSRLFDIEPRAPIHIPDSALEPTVHEDGI